MGKMNTGQKVCVKGPRFKNVLYTRKPNFCSAEHRSHLHSCTGQLVEGQYNTHL